MVVSSISLLVVDTSGGTNELPALFVAVPCESSDAECTHSTSSLSTLGPWRSEGNSVSSYKDGEAQSAVLSMNIIELLMGNHERSGKSNKLVMGSCDVGSF